MQLPPGWDGADDPSHYRGNGYAKKVIMDYADAQGLSQLQGDWEERHEQAIMQISRIEGLGKGDPEGPLNQMPATKKKIFAQIAFIPHLIDANAEDAIRRYRSLMTFKSRMGRNPSADELDAEMGYQRTERTRLAEEGAHKQTTTVDANVGEYYRRWKTHDAGSTQDTASSTSERVAATPGVVGPDQIQSYYSGASDQAATAPTAAEKRTTEHRDTERSQNWQGGGHPWGGRPERQSEKWGWKQGQNWSDDDSWRQRDTSQQTSRKSDREAYEEERAEKRSEIRKISRLHLRKRRR